MTEVARMLWVLVQKDLRLELRSRETLIATLSFALLVLAIFTVVLESGTEVAQAAAPAVLWIGMAFAAAAGFSRSFAAEMEHGAIDGLRGTLVNRDLLLVSKALSNFVVLLFTVIVLQAAFVFLFNLELFSPLLLLAQVLVVFGFSMAGTMFGAIAIKVRARQVLLSLLFVPAVAPLIVAAVAVTRLTLEGAGFAQIGPWLGLVIAGDAIFTACLIILANSILDE